MPVQTPFGPGLIGEIDDKLWNVVKKLANDAVTFAEPSIEDAFVAGGPGGNLKPTGLLYNQDDEILVLPSGGVEFPDGAIISSPAKSLVTSVNTLKGDVTLAAGANITITPAGQTLTFASTAGGLPSIKTLKETVFAGQPLQSFSNGVTYTIDGSGYTCTVAAGGSVDLVAAGLRMRHAVAGGANFEIMQLAPANVGNVASIVTEDRFRRSGTPWAVWIRFASCDFTNTTANTYAILDFATPKWGGRMGRTRNVLGSPNTTVGGLAYDYWLAGGVGNLGSYSSIGVSSADVMCWVFRTPYLIDVYTGTYSGGWPLLQSMPKAGTISMPVAGFTTNAVGDVGVTNMSLTFLLGASAASTATYEVIWDRWRITTWE